jgi:hypothetical protein
LFSDDLRYATAAHRYGELLPRQCSIPGGYRQLRCHERTSQLSRTTLASTALHSIINRSPKPAWLKGMAAIDLGAYRRFYRQEHTSFAEAGDGAICGATTRASLMGREREFAGAGSEG